MHIPDETLLLCALNTHTYHDSISHTGGFQPTAQHFFAPMSAFLKRLGANTYTPPDTCFFSGEGWTCK